MSLDREFLLIRQYDLFAQITAEEFEALNLIHHFKETSKGGYIYFEPEYLNKIYFLKDGFIKIGHINDQGEEVIQEILQQGDFFGQFTLEPNGSKGEFAQAYKSDVSLCAFQVQDFEKLLAQKPNMALQYTRQVGQKLRKLESRLVGLLHKDVKTRLISFLLYLAQEHPPLGGTSRVEMPNLLTHEEMTRMVGASRQTVTTLLNEWAELGWVQVNRQLIEIPDVKILQKQVNVG